MVEEEVGEEVEEVGKREMGDGRKRICERCVYRNYQYFLAQDDANGFILRFAPIPGNWSKLEQIFKPMALQKLFLSGPVFGLLKKLFFSNYGRCIIRAVQKPRETRIPVSRHFFLSHLEVVWGMGIVGWGWWDVVVVAVVVVAW